MADMKFSVRANFDEVTKARQELNRLRDELRKTTKATDPVVVQDLSDKYAEQKRKVSELSSAMSRYAMVMSNDFAKKMQSLTREVYTFSMQADASKRKIEQISSEIGKLESKMRKGNLDTGTKAILSDNISTGYAQLKDEKARLESLTGLGKQARLELNNMQAEYTKYSGSATPVKDITNQMTAAFSGMIEEMKKAPTVGDGVSSLFGRLNMDARQLAMGLVGGLGFEQLAEHIFNVRSQFQQLEISFTTMLGSEQQAGALMDQLVQTAARTPFNMTSITEGAKQLLAYGIQANEVNDTLVHLGDIAAGLNIPLGQLVYLYGTTISQGRMFTMDLRQFMGRGIPMAETLGEIMGKTVSQVQEAVSKGEVGADLVKQAILKMSAEGGRFGGLMDKQAETLQGRWSNIEDTVDQAFNEMGKKTEGIFGTGLDLISSLIENWETLVKVIGTAVVAVGTYKAGLMAAASIQKVQNTMTMASITEELNAKLGQARDDENNFRSLNGKDTKQYRSNRYKALGEAISDTENIGDDEVEKNISRQIEMAKNEGLITEQMAKQLELKREQLVAQQKLADQERMEYENAKRAKEQEEEKARAAKADAEEMARINKANSPQGKIDAKIANLEAQNEAAKNEKELAEEATKVAREKIAAIDAQIEKQKELVEVQKQNVVDVAMSKGVGGYEDDFSDDAAVERENELMGEQLRKLDELKQSRRDAASELYSASVKEREATEAYKDVHEQLKDAYAEEDELRNQSVSSMEVESTAQGANSTATQNNTTSKEANSIAEGTNATSKSANVGATTRQTIANGANTTSESANTSATNTNTISENANTAAKVENTVATTNLSLKTRMTIGIQRLWAVTNDTLKASLKSLWATMLANPITSLLTIVSTAISIFTLFGDETESAADKAEKLGNKAAEASSKVRTLFAVLAAGKAEDHKDTIDALKSAYEQYGVKLDEAKMKSENLGVQEKELIDNKNRLIGVIEEQTIAIEHQNAVQQAYDEYNANRDKSLGKFEDSADGILSSSQASFVGTLISQDDLDLMTQYQDKLYGLDIGTEEYQKTVENVKKLKEKMIGTINSYYKGLHLTNEQINELQGSTEHLIWDYERHNETLKKSVEEADGARSAAEKARNAIKGLSVQTKLSAARNQLAKKSFKELGAEMDAIRKICKNTYHMTIKVNYDDKALPSWIRKMSQKQLDSSLKSRLAWLKTHAKDAATATTTFFGGVQKSYAQIAQEAQMMQFKGSKIESTPTETEAQRKKRLAEEEKKKRAAERAAAKAEREQTQKETQEGNRRKATEDYANTISSYSEKADESLTKRRMELIKNETEKEIAQINQSTDKEKKAIEDGIDKLVEARKKRDQTIWLNSGKNLKANMWKATKTDAQYRDEVMGTEMKDGDGKSLGMTIGQNAKDQITLLEQQRQIKLKQIHQAEIKDMLDFMEKYGSIEQQRYALTKEYADKIDIARQGGDTFGAADLEMERDEKLKKLNFTDFKDSINWDAVFQDMSRLSVPYLEDLRKKLKDLLGSGTLEIDDMKAVSDQIYKIDDAISEQKDKWGIVNEGVREHKRLLEEAKDAQDRLSQAQATEIGARARLGSQQMEIQGVLADAGVNIDADKITSRNKENILGNSKLNTSQTEHLKKLFDELAVSEIKVGNATKNVKKAQEEYNVSQDKSKQSLHDLMGEWADSLGGVADKLKDLNGLVDSLGLANTGFGKAVANGMDVLNSGQQAFSDFSEGNYIGAAMNSFNAVKSIGRIFGIGGGNGEEVAKKTEELTKSNERLQYSIEQLKDSIDKTSGVNAINSYSDAYEAQKKINEQSMKILETQMGYHGAHHSNSYYWYLSREDYAKINETLARQEKVRGGYVNSTINKVSSLEDIYKLTPEQMKDIRTYNEDVWKNMLDQGKYDKSEYWENYTEYADKLEELTEQINQNLTQTSFDSMKQDFISNLTDMSKTASDFANDFTTMLNQSMLNFALSDLMEKKLKPLYEKWATIMRDEKRNLSNSEIEDFKREYEEITKEGMAIRDNIADITGYKQAYEQSASSGAFESMSQDTGEELNGRFTAVQIATEGTYQVVQSIDQKLSRMLGLDGDSSNVVDATKKEPKVENAKEDESLDFRESTLGMIDLINKQRLLSGKHSLEYESGLSTEDLADFINGKRVGLLRNQSLPQADTPQIVNGSQSTRSDSLLTADLSLMSQNVGNIYVAVDEGRTILAQSLMCLQSIDERQESWHKPMLRAFERIDRIADKVDRL